MFINVTLPVLSALYELPIAFR